MLPHSGKHMHSDKAHRQKGMRSEEITLRYQNKDQLPILKHIYAYKANTASNQLVNK